MNEAAFLKTTEEKRRDIINAGMACFGLNGYSKTSMNDIASAAGVSKASLFHYFDSKESFYVYLFDLANQAVQDRSVPGGEDFFECLATATKIKMEVQTLYPSLQSFLMKLAQDPSPISQAICKKALQGASGNVEQQLFAQVDWSKLQPDVSPADALHLAAWISMGCLQEGHESLDEGLAEFQRYMKILKRAIYREDRP